MTRINLGAKHRAGRIIQVGALRGWVGPPPIATQTWPALHTPPGADHKPLCEQGPLELCQHISPRAKVIRNVFAFLMFIYQTFGCTNYFRNDGDTLDHISIPSEGVYELLTPDSSPFHWGKWYNVTTLSSFSFLRPKLCFFKEERAEPLWVRRNQRPRLSRNWSGQKNWSKSGALPHLACSVFHEASIMDGLLMPGPAVGAEDTVVTIELTLTGSWASSRAER